MGGHMDFVVFVAGLGFVLLALGSVFQARRGAEGPAWVWLAWFAALRAAAEWGGLAELLAPGAAWHVAPRALLLAASLACLAEFGRRGPEGRPVAPWWVHAPALLAFAAGGLAGWEGAAAGARYGWGLAGGLFAAGTLALRAGSFGPGWGLTGMMAFCMALFALAEGLFPSGGAFWPASSVNAGRFMAATGMPIELIRGLLAGVAAMAAIEHLEETARGAAQRRRRLVEAVFLALFGLGLALGWGVAEHLTGAVKANSAANLLSQARLAAAGLDPTLLAKGGPALQRHLDALGGHMPMPATFRLDTTRRGVAESVRVPGEGGPVLGVEVPVGPQGWALTLQADAAPLAVRLAQVRMMVIVGVSLLCAMLLTLYVLHAIGREHALALERSERHYRSLFEESSAMMLVVDPQSGHIRDANPAAARFYGYGRAELKGMRLHDLERQLPPPPPQGGAAHTRHRRADGQEREVEVHSAPVTWDGVPARFLIVHDEAEEVRSREALRLSEAKLRSLMESAKDVVYAYDTAGNITYLSPSARRYGFDPDAMVEHNMLEFIHPDDRPRVAERSALTLATGEEYPTTLRVLLKDGRALPMEETGRALRDASGGVVSVVGTLRDITERHQQQAEQERMQSELFQASKLASIGLLAAGVAHEVNNPLTVLKSNLFVLRERAAPLLEEPLRKALERMENAVERVAEIVSSLRTYARADHDDAGIANLHAVIADTLNLVEAIYRKEGVGFQVEMRCRDPWVRGAAGRLQQVVMNLLSNARDATLAKTGPRTIRVITWDEPSGPCVQVQDNGCGMDPEQLGRLFTPFFSTKPPDRGTGLGLSISRQLVNEMGGTIKVESTPGVGSRFTVQLEQAGREPKGLGPEVPPPALVGGRNRVLLVDDDPDVREALREPLQILGQEVVEASSGPEALERLRAEAFDVVIVDVRMPGMDGDELLAKLHALRLPHLAGTRYLVISGGYFADYPMEQRQRLMALAHGYLLKPFSIEDLRKFFRPAAAAV